MFKHPMFVAVCLFVATSIGCGPDNSTSVKKSDRTIVADPEPAEKGRDEEGEQTFMDEEE